MTMAPFDELFPDLARAESRTIKVFDHDRLLPGSYLLREAYCVEPGCDCRRVLLQIKTPHMRETSRNTLRT